MVLPVAELELPARYEFTRELGAGATGRVLLAEDRVLCREVAIKVLRDEFDAADEAERRPDLSVEAKLLASLSHPAIVPVLDLIATARGPVVVMEYIRGGSLGSRLDAGAWPDRNGAMRILLQVAEALNHAHKRGIAHCDVKPDNVLLDESTRTARLADFGIALMLEESTTGGSFGSPGYIAPEVIEGEPPGPRADMYGFGVLAWELLAKQRAFSGASSSLVMMQQLARSPQSLSEIAPDLPLDVRDVVSRCCSLDPTLRPTDWDEVIAVLTRETTIVGGDHRTQLRGLGFLALLPVVGLVAVVGIVAIGWGEAAGAFDWISDRSVRTKKYAAKLLFVLCAAIVAGGGAAVESMRRRNRHVMRWSDFRILFAPPAWWPAQYPWHANPRLTELPDSLRQLRFAIWWILPWLAVAMVVVLLLAIAPTPLIPGTAARWLVSLGGLAILGILVGSLHTAAGLIKGSDFDLFDVLPIVYFRPASLGVLARMRARMQEQEEENKAKEREQVKTTKRWAKVGMAVVVLVLLAAILFDPGIDWREIFRRLPDAVIRSVKGLFNR